MEINRINADSGHNVICRAQRGDARVLLDKDSPEYIHVRRYLEEESVSIRIYYLMSEYAMTASYAAMLY